MGVSAGAFIWAAAYGGKAAVPFGALHVGERFHFPSTEQVFVKGKNGWYSDGSGKNYRMGGKVAVIKIKGEK